jgi:ESCRT-II complex subunit VPS36
VALISPEDLYKACQQFETLKLPYRLRYLSSSPKGGAGLLVVQSTFMNDDQASSRILAHVKSHQGQLTALKLAGIEQWALAVALEQLKVRRRESFLEGLGRPSLTISFILTRRLNKRGFCVGTMGLVV